jgi:Lar family restriction alleviation protein
MKWISVKDRLPDEKGQFLVNYASGNGGKSREKQWTTVAYFLPNSNDKWENAELGFKSSNVTHWAKISDIPKPEIEIPYIKNCPHCDNEIFVETFDTLKNSYVFKCYQCDMSTIIYTKNNQTEQNVIDRWNRRI